MFHGLRNFLRYAPKVKQRRVQGNVLLLADPHVYFFVFLRGTLVGLIPKFTRGLRSFVEGVLQYCPRLATSIVFRGLVGGDFVQIYRRVVGPGTKASGGFFGFKSVSSLSRGLGVVLIICHRVLAQEEGRTLPFLTSSFYRLLFTKEVAGVDYETSCVVSVTFGVQVLHRLFDFFRGKVIASYLGSTTLVGDRHARVATSGTSSITNRARFSLFRYQSPTFFLMRKVVSSYVERVMGVIRFRLHRELE